VGLFEVLEVWCWFKASTRLEAQEELQSKRPPLTLTDEDVAEGNGIGKFGFILDCNPVV